jgi:hypothetical protein
MTCPTRQAAGPDRHATGVRGAGPSKAATLPCAHPNGHPLSTAAGGGVCGRDLQVPCQRWGSYLHGANLAMLCAAVRGGPAYGLIRAEYVLVQRTAVPTVHSEVQSECTAVQALHGDSDKAVSLPLHK